MDEGIALLACPGRQIRSASPVEDCLPPKYYQYLRNLPFLVIVHPQHLEVTTILISIRID